MVERNAEIMTEYKLVVVGGQYTHLSSQNSHQLIELLTMSLFYPFLWTAGGVGKSALTIQLIQNQ